MIQVAVTFATVKNGGAFVLDHHIFVAAFGYEDDPSVGEDMADNGTGTSGLV